MSRPIALVTGAGGEIGRVLVPALNRRGYDVAAVDLREVPSAVAENARRTLQLDLLDFDAVSRLFAEDPPARVFHLAAILSTAAERDFERAHRVNVEATLNLFRLCLGLEDAVRFVFPSSIAVYGMPDAVTKHEDGAIDESRRTTPNGVYGCNKLYCEHVGNVLRRQSGRALDFRAIRFPGLISADSTPSGGTTDYAPQMIHDAAQAIRNTCFVEAGSRLPFMTMPDAVDATLRLADAETDALTTHVYNIRGFSASAEEFAREVGRHFVDARIDFRPDAARQALVDSWPEDIDDARARADWSFAPQHDLESALRDYMVPALRRRYSSTSPLKDRA